jgi:hypothetical protein
VREADDLAEDEQDRGPRRDRDQPDQLLAVTIFTTGQPAHASPRE